MYKLKGARLGDRT